jgi:hypothetical protein
MKLNITNKVLFEEQSIVDEAKVFYFEDRVLRAIYNDEQAKLYKRILNDGTLTAAFDAGLVKTKIAEDVIIDNCSLIIEHEKVDFFIDPSEMTNKMFWKAANTFVIINNKLATNNLILKDSHPWNITFHKGKPVFFDFSSVGYAQEISWNWINEFYKYFVVPIVIAHSKWPHLSNEYRRQHQTGFGLKLSEHPLIKKYIFRSFFKLSTFIKTPQVFFEKLNLWLLKYQAKTIKGNWDDYNQKHESNYHDPITIKQKFVFDILGKEKPEKVTDLATNKGYFAFMAESLGAKVIAFDYEEYSVDTSQQLINDQNISFCQMDFLIPTSPKGWGLLLPGAFQRFRSDIALGLGLIHHVCITQRFPVKLFCDSCAKYASKGVIIEFVFPDDIHVKQWNAKIPVDYSKENIIGYFSHHYKNFVESELITEDGIKRQFFYFSNSDNN